MPAYWITIYDEILDEEKQAAYAELAGPALAGAGGRFLARGMPEQVYEDDKRERTVIIEFPTVEQARDAYNSPAYQKALEALGNGAARAIRIVPGFEA